MKLLTRVALLLLLTLSSTSCVIVHSDKGVNRTGDYVSPRTLEQIKTGVSAEYVLAILGSPTTKSELENGTEIWKWRYTETLESHGGILIVFRSKSSTDTVHNSFVEFEDDTVVRTWRD